MFDSIDDLGTKLAATGYFIDPVMTKVFVDAELRLQRRHIVNPAKRSILVVNLYSQIVWGFRVPFDLQRLRGQVSLRPAI